MPKSGPEHAPLDLDAALEEIEQSGSSVAAFARERGLPSWKLYEERRRRRQRRRKREIQAEPEFVPVRLAPVRTSEAPFELLLRGGRKLRIPAGFDEATLQRLVRVLESC